MRRKCRLIAVGLMPLIALGACAPHRNQPTPPSPIVLAQAKPGVVLAAAERLNEGSETLADDGTGAIYGGWTGLVIGSFFGQGTGRALGALIGLGAGALVGAITENEFERRRVTEYLIRLDSGEEILVITRGAPAHEEGDQIRVFDNAHGYSVVFPA